jgi:alpha-galactosidase
MTNRGLVLGNEAPGVMKRTSIGVGKGSNLLDVQVGLTHAEDKYAFREWLNPGESWESDYTFISPYKDEPDPYHVIDDEINRFVTDHMDTRIACVGAIPSLIYNTWKPFSEHINEPLVKELADAADECGADCFIIDAGWYSEKVKSGKGWMQSSGDFFVDKDKFPDGLTPVYNYMHQKLPACGLWFSVSAAGKTTDVFKNNPDWFVKDMKGEYANLHTYDNKIATGCLTTGWYDYILDHLNDAVKEYTLNYLKVDLSMVVSAYRNDHEEVSGCAALNHEKHKDRNESYLRLYRRTYSLFDELHQKYRDLYIDCTFELMGAYQLIDYSAIQHAEGNWLSNFHGSYPSFGLDIRHLAWWRSPMMPAASLLIGNADLDDEHALYYLKCLAGTLPVMLGDLRKISPDKRSELKEYVTMLREVEKRHHYMLYRQELFGFGEPREGGWDGWQRINRETESGGLAGVFRHGSKDMQRRVTINYLNPAKKYRVIDLETGKTVITASGKSLKERGFEVTITKEYDGKLFEIRTLD